MLKLLPLQLTVLTLQSMKENTLESERWMLFHSFLYRMLPWKNVWSFQNSCGRIYNELGLPVYLYENSASKPHRTNLADIRRGEFEGLVEKMQSEDWKPDYGTKPHPTAGAVVIGARKPLIAFNMQLNTANIEIATEIAKKIREKNGGLKCVKALGIMLETKNTAQVSVNLTDYTVTSLFEVFDTVCNEASKMGYEVVSSELIGLSPARAFIATAARYLKLENYSYKKIIESHLLNLEI